MNKSIKDKVLCIVMAVFLFTMAITCVIIPKSDYSLSERRPLKQLPEISFKSLFSGKFMTDFESYTLDQFPLRDTFRELKALNEFKAMHKLDNNKVYAVGDYINKLEYPLNEAKVKYAADKFESIYENYLKDTGSKTYLSIIPDKNYFMAEDNGYLSVDYDKLVDIMRKNTPSMEYIDIFPYLELNDYYKTDTHWKQENLIDVANAITSAMGANISDKYTAVSSDLPFYGVYTSQYALKVNPDNITYLTSDVINSYKVYDHQNNKEIPVYDTNKLTAADPYELYLGGPLSLITIENPNGEEGKELIIFRDSFTSSLAPIISESYSKITLVDIRYIQSAVLGNFIEFNGQDVLFIYSSMVLNNSETIK